MKHLKVLIILGLILWTTGVSGVSASPGQIASRLAQAVLPWIQVNTDGFGDPGIIEVSALEAFNGYLYAGTHNPVDPAPLYDGAQIYSSPNGSTWTAITLPGFGIAHDIAPTAILDLAVFNTQIYASTGLSNNAGQIWRSPDGAAWSPMIIHGFNDPDNVDINVLAVYNGQIFAGVSNVSTGAKIYRSFSGDSNTWEQVAPAVPGTDPAGVTALAVFDGGLWALVESENGPVQVWNSYGGDWTTVVSDGFGESATTLTGGMAEFGGYLYVGTGNTNEGAQLRRTQDGVSWDQIIPPGSSDPNNSKVETVVVFQNHLFVSLRNTATGMEVWRSADGAAWEQVNLDGFGDANNSATNRSNASDNFLNQLYVGTSNLLTGGEVWRTSLLSPTDIALSNNTVNENQPVNTIVGGLTATSPDPSATFTFSLTCAAPGADDASFNILGTNLRTSAMFNFEVKSTYAICIRVTDQGGLTYDENFAITVNNVNEAPTNISLSSNTVDENLPPYTVVGALTATDPDAGATFTYSLVCAAPGADDGSFNILGANLRTSEIFNYAIQSTYNICIRATDQGGLAYDKNFVITVNNTNAVLTLNYLPLIFR